MNLYQMSQRLLAWSFGAIGSALRPVDDGSICCAPKPFCSPLARFSTYWRRMFNPLTCKPERSGPIGDSVGRSVWLAMLAPLPHRRLKSPSMVSRSGLLSPLTLMWRRLPKHSATPLASRISSAWHIFHIDHSLFILLFHSTFLFFHL